MIAGGECEGNGTESEPLGARHLRCLIVLLAVLLVHFGDLRHQRVVCSTTGASKIRRAAPWEGGGGGMNRHPAHAATDKVRAKRDWYCDGIGSLRRAPGFGSVSSEQMDSRTVNDSKAHA